MISRTILKSISICAAIKLVWKLLRAEAFVLNLKCRFGLNDTLPCRYLRGNIKRKMHRVRGGVNINMLTTARVPSRQVKIFSNINKNGKAYFFVVSTEYQRN